jgi:indolepyruvate ferredoxin oxidoreductase alpha subunit
VLREELASHQPSVVIAKSPCVLQYKVKRRPWTVDPELCTGCKVCLKAGCTALSLTTTAAGDTCVEIDPGVCSGCGVCAQLCKFEAISGPPEAGVGKDAS